MYFTNGTDTVEVFVDKETDIDGTPVPTGWVNLIGVVDQYDTSAPYDGTYEIRPRSVSDFQVITGVVQSDPAIPARYALSQNYPNPFNPETTISIDMPETGEVKIVVFDLLGKVVATLHDGKLNAGYHKLTFNGIKLSSGIGRASIDCTPPHGFSAVPDPFRWKRYSPMSSFWIRRQLSVALTLVRSERTHPDSMKENESMASS